jgi:hypothetical protein
MEQARRKPGAILWRDSVIFGENFSDGRILSAILLELHSKSSHLGRHVTASKLDHYLSTLFEGLSETAKKGKMFDQHMWNEKSKHRFINEIVDIAVFATQIPLSIFTNSYHQRIEKHSMLESMLEILQQFYIQTEIEPDDFHLFPGDFPLYTLRCIRCGQLVTLAGSIGETLLHASTAMLYHWNIIQSHDEQNHRELMLVPLLFTYYIIFLIIKIF